MSTKLSQKLERIDASMARIRAKTNLPNAVIEDVATAVEQLSTSGGGTAKSNIYKVATIADRNAINDMVEGDMCVVQESTIANITATTEFQTATCPATVVLPTALNDYVDVRFNAVDQTKMFDCWGDLNSNYFMMDCYTETGSVRIEYTSNDGITYTRNNPTEDTVDFGTPIVYSYPEMWNDAIGYFLQAGNVNFEGIFVYKDEEWEYADIGLNIVENDLFVDKEVYTSEGKVTGTLLGDVSEDTLSRVNKFLLDMQTISLPSTGISFKHYEGATIPITKYLNTSEVTNMVEMFGNCYNLSEVDVSSFDTSKVTSMANMFNQCTKLESLNVSNFNTSKVTSMYQMFNACWALTEINMDFDTSNVTDMQAMFASNKSLTSLDVSKFITDNVTNFTTTFMECEKLTTLDVHNFNTSKATTFSGMFSECYNLRTLDLSNFDTTNVGYYSNMFQGCSSLEKLDISNFYSENNCVTYQMFCDCSSLSEIDMRSFNFSKSTNYTNMFKNVPTNCLIIVKDTANKNWLNTNFPALTNVQTVAEYGG